MLYYCLFRDNAGFWSPKIKPDPRTENKHINKFRQLKHNAEATNSWMSSLIVSDLASVFAPSRLTSKCQTPTMDCTKRWTLPTYYGNFCSHL